jgi:uroporphyrinogen-III synthase
MQTIAIIRPKAQLAASKRLVEALGYKTIVAPLIDIVEIEDPVWPTFVRELKQGLVDYVVLTSANGVHRCVKLGLEAGMIPSATRVVALGPHTAERLREAGIRVDLMPHEFSSRGIVQLLSNITSDNIWLLRSAYGSDSLVDGLRRNGAVVNQVLLYSLNKLCGKAQKDFIRRVLEEEVAAVLFTSGMTVRSFFECASRISAHDRAVQTLKTRLVGAIGAPTADVLADYGVAVNVMPDKATFRSLALAADAALTNRA